MLLTPPFIFPFLKLQTYINSGQFVDFLASKASKEEAMEAFNTLEMEDGQVDVTWLLAVSPYLVYYFQFPFHLKKAVCIIMTSHMF